MSKKHWAEQSPEAYLYSIAADFVEQLRAKMNLLGMSQSELAKMTQVSKSYVSQVFSDPGNLSLITIVKFARAVSLNVSVVGYEAIAGKGPVNSDIFRLCWERQGRPLDLWSLEDNRKSTSAHVSQKSAPERKRRENGLGVNLNIPRKVTRKAVVTSADKSANTRNR